MPTGLQALLGQATKNGTSDSSRSTPFNVNVTNMLRVMCDVVLCNFLASVDMGVDGCVGVMVRLKE